MNKSINKLLNIIEVMEINNKTKKQTEDLIRFQEWLKNEMFETLKIVKEHFKNDIE
jgi:hypothetical protein